MSDGPHPQDADGLGELGRELRDRVGEEWRREAEESERLADLARRRRRSLADVAREQAERGVGVTLSVGGRVLGGAVVHAAGDLVTVRTAAGRAHLRADTVVLTVDRSRQASPGPGREDGVARWRARMYELEMAGAAVRVALTDGRDLVGVLAAVAADHLLVRTAEGDEHAVPDAAVAWVAEEDVALR